MPPTIVMEAITRVLGRLRSGPLKDERTYLMRVVFTTGARHLARRRAWAPLDACESDAERAEVRLQQATSPPTDH